jgi:hypothetical protein
MIIKSAFLALLLSVSVFSQTLNNFPLWGSSWVVAQGNNKRIFSSILPLKTKQTCFNRI